MKPMRSVALGLLALLASGMIAAKAETVMERVARTGELVAGTRNDARPFAYRDGSGAIVGFSVDILEAIRAGLAAELKKPVKLILREVSPSERVTLVADGTVDIECGITTATWERERTIDFTIPFFENGTRVLAPRGNFKSADELAGKRIGVIRNSTTQQVVVEHLSNPVIVELADMAEGFQRLTDGEIDGLANIGIILRARLETSDLKASFVLLPRSGALDWESIGCMVPSNDSAWRDFVNHTLANLLVGIGDYRGAWVAIYDRWFGPSSELYYPLDRVTVERLESAAYWLD